MRATFLLLAVILVSGCVSQPSPITTTTTTIPTTQETTTTVATTTTTTTTITTTTIVSAPKTVDVEIRNYAFGPKTITIKKGDTVRFTNYDSAIHTATSDTGKFDSGLLGQGESWSKTFTESGRYDYHCSPHPYMKATIVVE